ncbi:MAG: peptide-methionine (S)-S-oxide reductase MsrA [Clostridium sp.]|uniref:peptide-methionine (S)-S-oxide reductase MsrA n=1 Tax=Clostridium culturomicium TaxID=1499683 RepID=UPI000591819F|nr:peptide-methionine (S)-S-oxide reductase MsrA [Clostridium culturomicium]MDU4889148.1 peptide-methionine (S)-S-oxide reductase MsrA [Clostridium sp.]MDU7083208.1 peptide-methionine (S)-S-oxide reductase MsrA [Clostridium sp.]
MKKIVLAGGCFWGVQEYFSRINGILKTEVGYANGKTYNPTYEQVCNDNTGFAEVCYVEYDERIITLKDVLSKFWAVVNPTSLNRQGNDVGNQYRSGIYYFDEDDIADIQESIKELQKKYEKKIVTEVKPLENYFKAEEYHQDYLKKNPNGYCHINLG